MRHLEGGRSEAGFALIEILTVRAVAYDPCASGPFTYDTSMSGSPPTDFKLSVAFPLYEQLSPDHPRNQLYADGRLGGDSLRDSRDGP